MLKRRFTIKSAAIAALTIISLLATGLSYAFAANKILKIGFVGVTSGPAAAWGISNTRSMQARAAWINENGGVKIGGTTYDVKIVVFDDRNDRKRSIAGFKKMAQEGIHYVVGPNVEDCAAAVRPVAEENDIIYFPYAFSKSLYTAPASNAVLGMVANYQSGPTIYKFLMEQKGVKRVAFVAANEGDSLNQRESGIAAAKTLGLEIVSDNVTYKTDTTDFTAILKPVIRRKPDLLVLSGVAPANTPQLILAARHLGYKGLISTETAQEASVLQEGVGPLANGFISIGGASTPEIATDTMEEFVKRYSRMFGEYNDESNTKVYALEYILETMKANPAAKDNIGEFKKTMDTLTVPNIYMKGDAKLSYVGTSSFGQKRQISVPMVVNEFKDGKFETLFIAEVD